MLRDKNSGDHFAGQNVGGGSRVDYLKEGYVSYYFTNFEEEWTISKLWMVFKKEGTVVDIYVAKKKNNEGKRFGFVRFKIQPMESESQLLRKLKEICLGMKKITVNWATKRRGTRPSVLLDRGVKNQRNTYSNSWKQSDERSYKEVLRGERNKVRDEYYNGRRFTMKEMADEDTKGKRWRTKPAFIFDSKPEDVEWLETALVGEMIYPENVNILAKEEFNGERYGCVMRCLGGSKVLLTFLSSNGKDNFVKAYEEQSDDTLKIFGSIKPWESKDVDIRVFKWLRLEGIPLQAYNERFFSAMGNLWGTFVMTDKCTALKRRLDLARILVYTYRDDFPDFRDVDIDGEVWRIHIAEEAVCSMLPIPYDFNIPEEEDALDSVERYRPPADSGNGATDGMEEEESKNSNGHVASADNEDMVGEREMGSKMDPSKNDGLASIEVQEVHSNLNVVTPIVDGSEIPGSEIPHKPGEVNMEFENINGSIGSSNIEGLVSVEVQVDQSDPNVERPIGDYCERIPVEEIVIETEDDNDNYPQSKMVRNSKKEERKMGKSKKSVLKKRGRKKKANVNQIQEDANFWNGFEEEEGGSLSGDSSRSEATEVVKVAKKLGIPVNGTWDDVLQRVRMLV